MRARQTNGKGPPRDDRPLDRTGGRVEPTSAWEAAWLADRTVYVPKGEG